MQDKNSLQSLGASIIDPHRGPSRELYRVKAFGHRGTLPALRLFIRRGRGVGEPKRQASHRENLSRVKREARSPAPHHEQLPVESVESHNNGELPTTPGWHASVVQKLDEKSSLP